MRRRLLRLGAGVLLALYVVLAVMWPPEPWSGEILVWLLAAVLIVAAWLRAHRAPGHASRLRGRALALTAGTALVAALGFAALPQWGLVASYLGSGFRRQLIATAYLVVVTLVVLLFAMPSEDGAQDA